MTECAVFRAGDLEGTLVMKTGAWERVAPPRGEPGAACGAMRLRLALRIGLNRMWSILPNTTA